MAAARLPASFAAHVRSAGLIRAGDRLLVALSGGLDSVILLHLLRFHPPVPRLELYAAHLDHALRPVSAADAAWVAGLCLAWQVPLASERAAAPPRGEAEARHRRYEFLQRAADAARADWILTAHHADDQLETLLFRLARGTGLRGLRGIPERRGLVLRPLLPFRRAELVSYARQAGLHWREDESNRSLRFTRNRIRHVVLPALEAHWPGAAVRLLRLAAAAGSLEAAWQQLLPGLVRRVVVEQRPGAYTLARGVVREYHPRTRARVVRELAHRLGADLDRAATRATLQFVAAGESGSGVRLGPHLALNREFDRLILAVDAGSAGVPGDLPVRIREPGRGTGRARIGGQWFEVSWGPLPPTDTTTGASASFDPSAWRFPLELRGWQPGDRLRLGYGTKKLKKLFAERRIPRSRRSALPVLAEQAGPGGVLWVAGVARATPSNEGTEWWHITVRHGDSA